MNPSETVMDETGMKPRFHLKAVEVLVFMRGETGETELQLSCMISYNDGVINTRQLPSFSPRSTYFFSIN